jgi:hypothetical protein
MTDDLREEEAKIAIKKAAVLKKRIDNKLSKNQDRP